MPRSEASLALLENTDFNSRDTDELNTFGLLHVTKGIRRDTDGIMAKGEGSYVQYEDGRKFLDFTCGIGVTNLGHCHPKVCKAAVEQCTNLIHAQCSIAFHRPYLHLIKRLLPMMPHPSLDSFYFWNSGGEAIEAAIKLARVATGRQNIICMQGGYHGRTLGAIAVSRSKTIYSEGISAFVPGTFVMPYPYWHQQGLTPSTPASILVSQSLNQLDLLLAQQTSPRDTAAIIVEPALAEGGYVPAPVEFLKGLREACDKYGILLIVDEIQTGFGRTGKNFMIEYSGVRPDIMVVAKGIANGFPLSGVVSRKELTDRLIPGSLSGTYAGNAVSCAAAIAVADAIKEDNILANVQARSIELLDALNSLREDPVLAPHILDVRGRGLMIGIEFASPNGAGLQVDPMVSALSPKSLAKHIAQRCVDKGLLILSTSVYEVIRFIPPLNISQGDMKKGCEIFAEAVMEIVKEG